MPQLLDALGLAGVHPVRLATAAAAALGALVLAVRARELLLATGLLLLALHQTTRLAEPWDSFAVLGGVSAMLLRTVPRAARPRPDWQATPTPPAPP